MSNVIKCGFGFILYRNSIESFHSWSIMSQNMPLNQSISNFLALSKYNVCLNGVIEMNQPLTSRSPFKILSSLIVFVYFRFVGSFKVLPFVGANQLLRHFFNVFSLCPWLTLQYSRLKIDFHSLSTLCLSNLFNFVCHQFTHHYFGSILCRSMTCTTSHLLRAT